MKQLILIIGSVLAFSLSAFAGNPEVYIGGGLGQSQTSLSSSSSSDIAFKLIGGVVINPNLNAEIEFINLGKVTSGSVSASTLGLAGAGVGILPLPNNLNLFARFGLANLRTDWPGSLGQQSKTGLTGGAGFQLDFAPKSSGRLSYDRYQIGATDPLTGSIDLVMLSALFKF